MSAHHLQYICDTLNSDPDVYEPYAPATLYNAVARDRILSIPDEWEFDDEDSYCGVTFGAESGVPAALCRSNPTEIAGGKLYIRGDDGFMAHYFRLSRK